MEAFEYLSVVWSIVLGLALAHLLTAARGLVVERAGLRWSWTPVLWAAVMVLLIVQNWWAGFDLNTRPVWTFDDFAAILGQGILIYMAAALILPDARPDGATDLASHFMKVRRWFFSCLAGAILLSVVKELVIDGRLPDGANLIFHAWFLVLTIAGGLIPQPRPQLLVVMVFGVTVIAYIGMLFVGLG